MWDQSVSFIGEYNITIIKSMHFCKIITDNYKDKKFLNKFALFSNDFGVWISKLKTKTPRRSQKKITIYKRNILLKFEQNHLKTFGVMSV